MNRDHDDICGILITNRDRVARQSDSIRTEKMLGVVMIVVIAVTAYLVYRYMKAGEMVLALAGAQ